MNNWLLNLIYNEKKSEEIQKQSAYGVPKTDKERVMRHFNLTKEEVDKLSEEELKKYIEKLPSRGQRLRDRLRDRRQRRMLSLLKEESSLQKESQEGTELQKVKSLAKELKEKKKEIENILGDLKDTEPEDIIYYIGDDIADAVERHVEDAFEFDIKVYSIDSPKEVEELVDKYPDKEELANEIFFHEAQLTVESLGEGLKQKYDWIEDWYQEGRMGGWFVIKLKDYVDRMIISLSDIQNFLYEIDILLERFETLTEEELKKEDIQEELIDDFENMIKDAKTIIKDANDLIKNIYKIREDLRKIDKEIKDTVRNFVKNLESLEWWKQNYPEFFEIEKESSLNKEATIIDTDKVIVINWFDRRQLSEVIDKEISEKEFKEFKEWLEDTDLADRGSNLIEEYYYEWYNYERKEIKS